MDLATLLAAPPRKQPAGRRSVIDDWADTLPDSERAAVYQAAANPAWGHVALRDTLVEAGAPFLADTSLRTWRKKHGWRSES